ncbi:DcaP family trimeric outer membrane transporter [Flavobacterium sp. LAR06]|uniref:DcaP family trimeric outer membrane transporter n=1 Tax=Flavobacterium sp. LAR06 TaxID=3064897 RepID=UPI0035C19414
MKNFYIYLCLFFVLSKSIKAQTAADTSELEPGWWKIPQTETRFKVGGYVKFDLIHDFDPIASPDFFDVSKIPTDNSEGESTHMLAKESRINLDFRVPTKIGELKAFIEGDFYGTSSVFRLRHAFVEIGGWLAGQTWSNFMDETIIPNTLDFEKPSAYAFARHTMLRYKFTISKNSYFSLAIEEPSALAQVPSQPGTFESPLPDLTARYRLSKEWGHIQLSGFIAKLRYRYTAGGKEDIALYGFNLSGQINFSKNDKFIYQGLIGPGLGRMRGGLSAGLDETGKLKALDDHGFTLGLQHDWSPSLFSCAVYNQGAVDNTAGQAANSLHKLNYVAVDLQWKFIKNALTGIEYLHGTREDNDNSTGKANRIQFSVKYTFN